jgi:hypothetical protein
MCNGSCKRGNAGPDVVELNLHETLEVVTEPGLLDEAPRPPELLPEQMMYKPFFDLVADKANWKNPIYARIKAPQGREDRKLFKQLITKAVEFYAGCTPLIQDTGAEKITVRAVGYYKAVGA